MRTTFHDRTEAGRLLARELVRYSDCKEVLVLGLPRGGVPVAYEIAAALDVPLDVFVVRKLGAPGHRELAIGAIATGGVRIRNESTLRDLDIPESLFDEITAEEMQELRRREMAYRGRDAAPELGRRTVILVDDVIATGSTMRAAIEAVKRQKPARLIVAIPTAAKSTCETLRPQLDELVVLMAADGFRSVGQWYDDFSQTTDAEVTRLLNQAKTFGIEGSATGSRPD